MKKIASMLCLVFVLFQMQIRAQVTTASISGYVTDDKAGLPGATIIAIHEPSGTQYGTTSLENGSYHLPNLRVGGPYKVTITFLGYEPAVYNDIWLSLGQDSEIKSSMKATGVTMQEVVVSGWHDPVFNADHTGAATNISNEYVQRIPSINRSISDMTRLSPQSTGNNTFGGRNNLYNNLTINGSLFNNAFGLASMPGGQTNSQPISLDAIDQIQVSIAPYDVRQSDFTGAGINAITRSGTNEFTGSAYIYWRNQQYLGTKVENTNVARGVFNQTQKGFRIGGPIIKNKLFFFLNGEMERRTEPAHSYVAGRPGLSGSNVATIQASTLDSLRNFLISKFNYDPGQYENFNLRTYNDKILLRLDYNIAQHHKLSLSYNYLKSWKDIVTSTSNSPGSSRIASQSDLWFSNEGYRINNNINSVVAELNSIFGNSVSNNLIIGYSAFRDFRSSPSSPFPMVDILNGGSVMTSFGYEQFTPNNKLNTDVIQASDNFTIYKDSHTFTLGGAYEHYHFENGFTPQFYGYYRYNSLSDFYADARDGLSVPINNYQLTYSALAGVPVPLAKISVAQIGFYAQDEWQVSPTLKVNIGIRADLPSYPNSLLQNTTVEGLTFSDPDGNPSKINESKLPAIKLLWSPRFGFNWDVFGDKTTQVRGGTGIFTGHIPFVWISDQASNNGILFGNINVSSTASKPVYMPFSPDVNKYIPANPTLPPTVLLNATSPDFKFPQVLRTNVAIDRKLPFGIVGTLEGIYTKDINAVIHKDYNLKQPSGTLPDGRDTFPKVRTINSSVTGAYVLENTSQGYSYFLTAQLRKTFALGLDASVAFTYGQTKDLSANPSAIAGSAFSGNQVQSNPNKPELSWSSYDQPYKFIAYVTYHKEYLGHFGSSIMLIYNAVQGGGGSSNERPSDGRFSYTYGGDLNRDGISGNDLIYIPRDQSEINLVKASASDTRTPDQIWSQLNAYIEQDDYLKKHRGQIMQRNGAITPWNSQVDLKFIQDLFLNVGKQRNTLEFSLDVINFTNLLNNSWGLKKTVLRRQLLNFQDFGGPNGTPRFSFPYFDATKQIPLTSTFGNDVSLASRWQLQFGLRYIF